MPYPDHCPVVPSGGNQWKQPDPLLTYPSSIPYQRDHLGRLSLYCLRLVWCSEAASLTHPGHLRVSTSTVRHAVTGYQKPILYMSCRTCTPPHWSKPRQQLVILYRLARRQQWLKVKEHDTNSILNHRSVKRHRQGLQYLKPVTINEQILYHWHVTRYLVRQTEIYNPVQHFIRQQCIIHILAATSHITSAWTGALKILTIYAWLSHQILVKKNAGFETNPKGETNPKCDPNTKHTLHLEK